MKILGIMKNPVRVAVLLSAALAQLPALADTPSACRTRCNSILDNIEYPTDGGANWNDYHACVSHCDALASVMNTFRECIQNAQNNGEAETCRANYRRDRPR